MTTLTADLQHMAHLDAPLRLDDLGGAKPERAPLPSTPERRAWIATRSFRMLKLVGLGLMVGSAMLLRAVRRR